MAGIKFILTLLCLVVILPNSSCQQRPFWRLPTRRQKPTLPPIEINPEFYRKLQQIPPKNETARKVITNILRILPGGKRGIKLEDVVIVIDGSGSIGTCGFTNGKKAMQSLIKYKQSGINAKYAMVTFANDAKVNFNFLSHDKAVAKISGIKHFGGGTNTQAGLGAAFKLFKKGSRGSHSRKVLLLLTDGQSNIKKEKTVPSAKRLKDSGVEVFVIAIGGQHIHGIQEMARVATFPPAKFLFRVKKAGDFLEVVKLAIKQVSPGQYKLVEKYKSTCR